MAGVFVFVAYASAALSFLALGIIYYVIHRERQFRDVVQSLDLKLFRILLAEDTTPDEEKREEKRESPFLVMEQLYAGFLGIRQSRWRTLLHGAPSVALELVLPETGRDLSLYAAVPHFYASSFEKLVHSFFPSSKVEHVEDYNIFNSDGATRACYLMLTKEPVLPIHTYEHIAHDPFSVVSGAFAKLKEKGEGAAVQLVLRPTGGRYQWIGKEAARAVRAGRTRRDAIKHARRKGSWLEPFAILFGFTHPEVRRERIEGQVLARQGDEETARMLDTKASRAGFEVNIRLVASASSDGEAERILQELESAFTQFTEPQGNSFRSVHVSGRAFDRLIYHYSFRIFNPFTDMYLATDELASVLRFPSGVTQSAQLSQLRSRESPPPPEISAEGILIGESVHRGEKRPIRLATDDRRRHLYAIGQTGTGKTAFLEGMIMEDVRNGKGVCFIDPHGDTVKKLLGLIPKERAEDVIYFDPADTERPIGLNFLEYDPKYPEQKTFIVNELLEIFNKLYNMSIAGGPMFEQYFRNATMLVMEDPDSGSTLLEVGRVLADKEFRDLKLSRCKNPVVETFWKKIAEKAGGESSLANMVPYITSKTDTFTSNEIMRPIIAQQHSSFNFREVMDSGKILLVNLSKGRLGELNAALLGLILVGKVLMAALSRTDMDESARRDFYLYIDEFQNVTTKSIATILSEARKYKLDLIIAHQFIAQLEDEIRDAVFGNVGTMVAFRVGAEDAEVLEKQLTPIFTARDLMNIDNWRCYVKLLVHGRPIRPFDMRTIAPEKGSRELGDAIRELSRVKYGKDRAGIEEEIMRRYQRFAPARTMTVGGLPVQ